jgi:hypothetical protein
MLRWGGGYRHRKFTAAEEALAHRLLLRLVRLDCQTPIAELAQTMRDIDPMFAGVTTKWVYRTIRLLGLSIKIVSHKQKQKFTLKNVQ